MSGYMSRTTNYSNQGAGGGGWDAAIATINSGTNLPARASEGIPSMAFNVAIGDPVDRLPAAARDKMLALREVRFAAFELLKPLGERRHEAILAKEKAANELRRLQEQYRHAYELRRSVGNYDETDPARLALLDGIEKAKARVAQLDGELQRVTAVYDTHATKREEVGALLDHTLEPFLTSISPTARIAELDLLPAKLRKSENWTAAVERVRAEREKMFADLNTVRTAPVAAPAAKQQMRQEVERLAKDGAPILSSLMNHGERIAWPTTPLNARVWGHVNSSEGALPVTAYAKENIPDGTSLMAWLFKDQIVARLEAEIDALDTGSGLTDQERADREGALLAAIFGAEVEEEGIITQAADHGQEIPRRRDADPRAVFGVEVA